MSKKLRGTLVTGEDGESLFVADENQEAENKKNMEPGPMVPMPAMNEIALLDHYAAHAPEVPEWFTIEDPDGEPLGGHEWKETRFFQWRFYYAREMVSLSQAIKEEDG